jgi:hypothetical protein
VPADSQAHRATGVAADLILNTRTERGGDAAAVSPHGTVDVTNLEAPGSDRPQASSEGLLSTFPER